MKIGIAQINFTVGAFDQNIARMRQAIADLAAADLIVFPEASLCGYPQQDLLDYPSFAQRCEEAAQKLVKLEPKARFIFGSVETNREDGKPYRNVAIYAEGGEIKAKYFKRLLPSYDVFDEDRFFEPGRSSLMLDIKGKKIAVTICEDIWNEAGVAKLENRYHQNPLEDCQGADVIVNLSASPFEYNRVESKRAMLSGISQHHKTTFVYVNCVGANDGIIFDGRSYVWGSSGQLLAAGKAFEEDCFMIDSDQVDPKTLTLPKFDKIKDVYEALMLGIEDYCAKQGFDSVLLGMSGGIDSSVLACIAADAIGAENVVGVLLPSRFTSSVSTEDALHIARAMQNPIHILPIEEVFQASLRSLSKAFEGLEPSTAEENLQSRARGLLMMGLSNKFNHLLLSTGNKSELAVGYCTLYGDMCGGLAPLADVYKDEVYALGREANNRSLRIPERVFTRPPSAELKPNQTDQDTLPPYDRLDAILRLLLEDFLSEHEIVAKGFAADEVRKICVWVNRSEYKRAQMAPGLKVSSKAYGVGRRIPIVHKFFEVYRE